MPVGNNHKELEIWDGIIEKTEKRLVNRKANYLISGRKSHSDQFGPGCFAYICYVTFPFTSKGRREVE